MPAHRSWRTPPTRPVPSKTRSPDGASLKSLYQPPARLLRLDRSFAAHHAPDLTGLLDTLFPPTRHVWTRTCLVHGDPSPPNTLIRPDGVAVLIDCENAALAHPGLDLGRALFHAHWHSATSADALMAGYTDLYPLPDQFAAWTAAAGIHIAAWRHSHRRRQAYSPGAPPWSRHGTGPAPPRSDPSRPGPAATVPFVHAPRGEQAPTQPAPNRRRPWPSSTWTAP
ncbi:phosphotransferase family protein [Streptomyces sp. NPDC008001]|uniref:phosphotransferase family protein n=1 Tax=Streptomyces sp. NPDC008001 TaxID=3364804 RepID=UPI0036E2E66F